MSLLVCHRCHKSFTAEDNNEPCPRCGDDGPKYYTVKIKFMKEFRARDEEEAIENFVEWFRDQDIADYCDID